MARKKGTVSRVGKGQYSFYIQLDDNDFYFNTKFQPPCGVGDVVGITFTKKDDKRGNISNVKVFEKNSVGYEASASGGSRSGGGGSDARQDSIVYQSSRKDALVYVSLLLGAEAFPLKGKPDAKRTQIEELIDETIAQFFKDATEPKKALAALAGETETDDDDFSEQSDEKKDEWDDEDEKDDTWED